MHMDDRIKTLITENIEYERMQLINDSHKHSGHAGDDGSGQTHYTLIVVSKIFEGQSRLNRQRMVLDHLKPAFENGLHALSLKLFTENECKKQKNFHA